MITLKTGQEWIRVDQIGNPFYEDFATIIDIQDGWVKYSYTTGGGSSMKIDDFIYIYSLKEAPDADKS